MLAMQTLDVQSPAVEAPFNCEIVAVMLYSFTGTDAETTMDVVVNTVDSGVLVKIPDSSSVKLGVEAEMDGRVFMKRGDKFRLSTNGETSVVSSADVTWVVVPTESQAS